MSQKCVKVIQGEHRPKSFLIILLLILTIFMRAIPDGHATGFDIGQDWFWRVEIHIDSDDISADLTNYPLYVRLDSTVLDWQRVENDLSDIRFTDSNNVTLDYELESYIENSVAHYWVLIPSISNATDTIFYVYYGNPDAVSIEDPETVWDSDFEQVHHLYDLSESNNDRTLEGTADSEPNGYIDGAYSFDGTEYLRNVNAYNLAGTGNTITVEAWVNCTLQAGYAQTLVGENSQWHTIGYLWCARGAGTDGLTWEFGDGVITNSVTDADYFSGYNNVMVYVVVVANYTGDTIEMFRNGVSVYTNNIVNSIYPNQNTQKYVGAFSPTGHRWNGLIDEWRLSSTNRSDAYITANYEAGTLDLLTFGPETEVYQMSTIQELFIGDFALFMFLIYCMVILFLVFRFKSVGVVFAVIGGFILGFQYLEWTALNVFAFWYFIGSMLLMVFSVLVVAFQET